MTRTWLVVGCMAASGCTVAVTEAQMQDRAQVALLSQKVTVEQDNKAHAKRIAFIGVEAPNQIQDPEHYWTPGGVVGSIIDTVAAMKQDEEKSKMLACRALDASYDSFVKSLNAAGYELVPFEEQLTKDPRFSIFTGVPIADYCQAQHARARMNYLNPFKWKDTFRVVQELIDALGVDGIVMANVAVNGLESGQSHLGLYVKNPAGYAVVGWSGRVNKGKYRFEPAAPGKTDEDRLVNAVRVFSREFDLMAARMGAATTK